MIEEAGIFHFPLMNCEQSQHEYADNERRQCVGVGPTVYDSQSVSRYREEDLFDSQGFNDQVNPMVKRTMLPANIRYPTQSSCV